MRHILMAAAALSLLAAPAFAAASSGTPNAPASTVTPKQTPQPTEAQPHQDATPKPPEAAVKVTNVPGIDVGMDNYGIYLDETAQKMHPMEKAAWDNFGHWYADPNFYHPYNKANWHEKDCFPVARRAYDQRGQQVMNVASMCYKNTGMAFITDGSRKTIYETDAAGPR